MRSRINVATVTTNLSITSKASSLMQIDLSAPRPSILTTFIQVWKNHLDIRLIAEL